MGTEISVAGPDPHRFWSDGSGSQKLPAKLKNVSIQTSLKIVTQNRKKLSKFHVWSAGCSLLGTEDFSCSLDVFFYEGLGICILQKFNFFPSVQFLVIKIVDMLCRTGSGFESGPALKPMRIRNTARLAYRTIQYLATSPSVSPHLHNETRMSTSQTRVVQIPSMKN